MVKASKRVAPAEPMSIHGRRIVSLEVPGSIEWRDVVLRTVSTACRLIVSEGRKQETRGDELHLEVVSAVGEAYNNIVLHGYAGREPGSVHVEIESFPGGIRIAIRDNGASFDPAQALPPDLAALPESGLGIFVMRSMVDEVFYVPGPPNKLTLVKRFEDRGRPSARPPREPW
jgi:serine/threonine-protein kinase RsbW